LYYYGAYGVHVTVLQCTQRLFSITGVCFTYDIRTEYVISPFWKRLVTEKFSKFILDTSFRRPGNYSCYELKDAHAQGFVVNGEFFLLHILKAFAQFSRSLHAWVMSCFVKLNEPRIRKKRFLKNYFIKLQETSNIEKNRNNVFSTNIVLRAYCNII